MKERRRENVSLSTKFTPQIADGTADAMQHMIDGSRERLHTEVIDIYWIHNPMDVEKWTPDLIPLAKSGQIKAIGVTRVHQVEEAAAAARIVLNEEEVSRLEEPGDETGVDTLREWEKEMA